MNKQALKDELLTDPLRRGYAGMSDEGIAATFALVDRQANRESLDGGQLAAAIARADFAGLAAPDREWLRLVSGVSTPLPLTGSFVTDLKNLFPSGTPTRASLVAFAKRPGTRAEELNLGGVPTASDVADAKRL